jgi:hypothetical protein
VKPIEETPPLVARSQMLHVVARMDEGNGWITSWIHEFKSNLEDLELDYIRSSLDQALIITIFLSIKTHEIDGKM